MIEEFNQNDVITFYPRTRQEWRSWLQENHDIENSVWLIYYKKKSNIPTVIYSEAVDEALCFGLPIILSDMVGSAYDLIDGNGFMYPSGDCQALAHHIHHIFSLSESDFLKMKQRSTTIIQTYSYDNIIAGIKAAARQNQSYAVFQNPAALNN